ncbi:MAG: radical SAM family heme chaperone HemW [Clostridiales bacterium]|nr:radical SAM family heme chaperone HemW [Clostridiales bacterium]
MPFCQSKCPYCDFYSFKSSQAEIEAYSSALINSIDSWAHKLKSSVDSLYFGGGTPSQAGADRLAQITQKVYQAFNSGGQEILEASVECNPSDTGSKDVMFDFEKLAQAGINRISLGLQSALDEERAALGRLAGVKEAGEAIKRAKAAGIDNISLDLMLAIPGQTKDKLRHSLEFCAQSGAKHVSAYLLKIEESTPFYKVKDKLNLPDEDAGAELYLFAVEKLESYGFKQYEISNFAKEGYECYHNLKYWQTKPYLGLGPSAHSFIDGKRFYYPENLSAFLDGQEPHDDGKGGGIEEFVLLALRLKEGLVEKDLKEKFGIEIPPSMRKQAEIFQKQGLMVCDEKKIALTARGFLLSNPIISRLLEEM